VNRSESGWLTPSSSLKRPGRSSGRALRIGSILDETWLRLLRDTVDEEIRNAGPGGHFADPGRATFFASIRPWRWRDAFRRFVFESPPGVDFMTWTLQPGDCVVHHARTVHGGGGNQSSDRRRRGYSTRWFGDDVVYEASAGRVQLEECRGLADGDPLPSEAFPLVSTKELCR